MATVKHEARLKRFPNAETQYVKSGLHTAAETSAAGGGGKKSGRTWIDQALRHVFWFTVTWLYIILIMRAATPFIQGAAAEPLVVVRIPTGSESNASAAIQELERIGLGNRVDHGRVVLELEGVFDPVELRRLQQAESSTLDLSKFPPISEWTIVRNMTGREDGIPRPNTHDRHRPEFYLPLNTQRYHNIEEIEHILRAFSRGQPGLASVQRVTTTDRGSIVWAMRLSGTGGSAGQSRNAGPASRHGSRGWRRRHRNQVHGRTGGTQNADGGAGHHRNTHQSRRSAEQPHKPAMLITGSFHGNDLIGQELCLQLIQYLCQSYNRVPAIRRILDSTDLYIIPVLNPDATFIAQRYTHRGIDLDRAFPDRVARASNPVLSEPEIQGITGWLLERNFVAAVSLLGGGGGPEQHGLVIRYPWNSPQNKFDHKNMADRTLDDRAFRYLARSFVSKHAVMRQAKRYLTEPEIATINGAEWYPRRGSMQDWIYEHVGTIHLDLVICPYLRPLPQHLPTYWEQNSRALIGLIQAVDSTGVRGTVVDAHTKQGISGTELVITDMHDRSRKLHPIRVNHREGGFFARFLVPGRYSIRAAAVGYHPSENFMFTIHDPQPLHTLEIELRPHA